MRRPGDLVARYAGKVFAVVMSRTDQQGAYRVAHQICAAIEGLAIEHPESDVSPCVTARRRRRHLDTRYRLELGRARAGDGGQGGTGAGQEGGSQPCRHR